MLTAISTTIILLVFAIFLIIIIPLLDSSKIMSKYISLRYILTVIVLLMGVGCILDFSHLNESSRNIVLIGSIGLTCLYIVLRTLEKNKFGIKKFNLNIKRNGTEINTCTDIDEHESNAEHKD